MSPTLGNSPPPRRPFTDAFLRSLPDLPPGTSATRIADPGCQGLYLARSGASRSWLLRYRDPATHERCHLGGGAYPTVSLRAAREWATTTLAAVRRGENPRAARAGGVTFGEVARSWFDTKAKRAERTRYGIWQRIESHLLAPFGARPIASITRAEVATVLVALEKPTGRRGVQRARGGPEVARRTRGILGEILSWAANRGLIADTRALPDPGIFEDRRPVHHAALPVGDLTRFLEAFARNETNARFSTRIAIALEVLLWQRSGEVLGMRVDELDLEAEGGAVWTIPAERMKRRRAHRVPLPAAAVALLRAALPYARHGLVFPGYGKGGGPLSSTAILKAVRELGFPGITVHGFRALARTVLAEAPFAVPAEVLEAQLSHAKESSIVAAYDRGDRLVERRTMLEQWSAHLEALRPGWMPVRG